MTMIQNDMEWRVSSVEKILSYSFKDKKLLEEALTHPSCAGPDPGTASYQRLEFLGDVVLGMAVSDFIFRNYPSLNEGDLTLLKIANTTNEKLARVALHHRLYSFLRTAATPVLDYDVQVFKLAVEKEKEEVETIIYGGAISAPKVLADVVESVIGAVYLDCDADSKYLNQLIMGLLEPIITPEALPMIKLFELGQNQGKKVLITEQKEKDKITHSVYGDEEAIAMGSSSQREGIAEITNARVKLEVTSLDQSTMNNRVAVLYELDKINEVEAAEKLHNLCARNKWVTPIYRLVREEGPPHDKSFTYSVEIETEEGNLLELGNAKSRSHYARNSAALSMIRKLLDLGYLSRTSAP